MFLFWKVFTYFRSSLSNANLSVDGMGPKLNIICENSVCQNSKSAKMSFIFVILASGMFRSTGKLWLIGVIFQMDQYWELHFWLLLVMFIVFLLRYHVVS